MIKKTLSVCALLGAALLSNSQAALTDSNWTISGDTLSFDISGTIDSGVTIGANFSNFLLIGVAGDTDWIDAASTSLTVINHAGANRDISSTSGFVSYTSLAIEDAVLLGSSDNGAWAIGDVLDATVTLSGGTLNAANFDAASAIIVAGSTDTTTSIDSRNLVGTVEAASIPEPSSALLLGVSLLGLSGYRKRPCQA